MLTAEIRIVIPGRPAPKGSLKCVGGRGGRHQLVEDNARTKPWREAIANAIRHQWPTDQHADPRQPLVAEITTSHARPDGHYGTGRNAHQLKPGAPVYVDKKPDIDKLVRSTLDALTSADVLRDDAQVGRLVIDEVYANGPSGACITIIPLDPHPDSVAAVASSPVPAAATVQEALL